MKDSEFAKVLARELDEAATDLQSYSKAKVGKVSPERINLLNVTAAAMMNAAKIAREGVTTLSITNALKRGYAIRVSLRNEKDIWAFLGATGDEGLYLDSGSAPLEVDRYTLADWLGSKYVYFISGEEDDTIEWCLDKGALPSGTPILRFDREKGVVLK